MPREIRNKIYRNLLCSFAPAPVKVLEPELGYAEHDNSTSILLASRQIHKEAYDTMVKTNRFVRVTTSGGFPLLALLNHLRVPVVVEGHESSQFKGYVLSVSLTCPKHIAADYEESDLDTDPCNLMLLGRDMDRFCEVLMDGDVYVPGFGMHIAIKIAVAPGSILELMTTCLAAPTSPSPENIFKYIRTRHAPTHLAQRAPSTKPLPYLRT